MLAISFCKTNVNGWDQTSWMTELKDILMREIDFVCSQTQKISSYWIPDLFKYAWERNLAHSFKLLILWLCFIESNTSRCKNIVTYCPLRKAGGGLCDWSNLGLGAHLMCFKTYHLGHKTPVCQRLQLKSRRDSFSNLLNAQATLFWWDTDTEFWYLIHTDTLPSFTAC